MARKSIFIIAFIFSSSVVMAQSLSLSRAESLTVLPLKCLEQEYPNKLGQTLSSKEDLSNPKKLHPAFYGCFDWHSSVHGHWSLVYLLRKYPQLKNREDIIKVLSRNLSEKNIKVEITYFLKPQEKSFERTYGWNWILKLQLELNQINEDWAHKLSKNLLPLSNLIVERYQEYLPKLTYPLRNGTHTNSAFGLTFAWDYAEFVKNEPFKTQIQIHAKRLYVSDKNYPFEWEPSGTDFLSPGLEQIGLMSKVLSSSDFMTWLQNFAPEMLLSTWKLDPATVSDRTDGYIVHLDGLNFSRAWNLYDLAYRFPEKLGHLKSLADIHLNHSINQIVDGNYEGEHWLTSFALLALEKKF